jgi:hypothetical protein
MIPTLREFLAIVCEDLDIPSKLPVPKNEPFVVTAGSHVANDIEQDVFDMIQKSYEKIGGHAKIQHPRDIGKEYPHWLVMDVDDDPEPDLIRASSYSTETGGLKGSVFATDGTQQAKTKLMGDLKDFHSQPGNWSEVSGAIANVLIKKLGLNVITDQEKVRKILGPSRPITWTGKNTEGDSMGVDGWYIRKIGGHEHSKIIVGNI